MHGTRCFKAPPVSAVFFSQFFSQANRQTNPANSCKFTAETFQNIKFRKWIHAGFWPGLLLCGSMATTVADRNSSFTSDILAESLFDDQLLADFPPGRKEELRGVGIADPQHPKPLVDKGEAFMSNLARARARQAPAILQESVAAALTARWSATLTHAATIGHPSHRNHTKSLQR